MIKLIDKLNRNKRLETEEWIELFKNYEKVSDYAKKLAYEIKKKNFGDGIYIRGLIEISNYCKNNCLYCGIRRGNKNVSRYRLSKEEILDCCRNGYPAGFRSFVLQGGEDSFFTDDILCDIIGDIKKEFPDCAVTLSLGERDKESYERLFNAGADRYLLRHETADEAHYQTLHPDEMDFKNRMECLKNLKEIGFQTGCGIMVGSPNQREEQLAKDMIFISEFVPHMVGIGPFMRHHDTPFKNHPDGSVELTLFCLSVVRIMLPKVLLPATTALASKATDGRERGILAGANVVMPNLSPMSTREKYALYDNKLSSDAEAAEGLIKLAEVLKRADSKIEISRGDSPLL